MRIKKVPRKRLHENETSPSKSQEDRDAEFRAHVQRQVEQNQPEVSKYYAKLLHSAASHGGKWMIPNIEKFSDDEIADVSEFLYMRGWTSKSVPSETGVGKTLMFIAPEEELALVGGVKKRDVTSAQSTSSTSSVSDADQNRIKKVIKKGLSSPEGIAYIEPKDVETARLVLANSDEFEGLNVKDLSRDGILIMPKSKA